jgi:glutamine synthetase
VKDAAKRGLLNLRRTPEALAQLTERRASDLFIKLGILSKEELESRYHVKLERYIKDLLIELHTLKEIIDTLVLPAAYSYAGALANGAARAKEAGIKNIPQIDAANALGKEILALTKARGALVEAIDKAESKHDDPGACGAYLTSVGAERMAAVRDASDRLELMVADESWPLPKYREMLFPV